MQSIHDQDFTIPEEFHQRAAVLKFFHTPGSGGVVKAIYGMDFLENEPDIVQHKLNFCVGDEIKACVSDSARIGFYIACCKDYPTLQRLMQKVEQNVSFDLGRS
ncbi:MAG: hypothetical protein K6G56_07885 [Clostridiales bacterium]|nr:hypothetical protein [Clostridiales bacterium]